MDDRPATSQARLAVAILFIVVIGIPLMAYLWETVNRLLAGVVDPVRLAIAVPVLLAFVLVLGLLRRALLGWDGQWRANVDRSGEGDRA